MRTARRLYREFRTLLRPVRAHARRAHGQILRHVAEQRRRARRTPHGLPGELVVSLTSYPPRFPTIAPTLRCLLTQSMRPDRVVLWIAREHAASLQTEIWRLRGEGLEIRCCEDIGPYKKLIPSLRRWPGAFIATADDDVFYPRRWLEQLVRGFDPSRREIPCHRAHLIRLDAGGAPAPYLSWRHEAPPGSASPLTFATGVGGVLYPPGSLHPDAVDAGLISALAPSSDDAWIYWMARLNGWRFRRIGNARFVCWPGSQDHALQIANAPRDNDEQIARLIARFGFPGEESLEPTAGAVAAQPGAAYAGPP